MFVFVRILYFEMAGLSISFIEVFSWLPFRGNCVRLRLVSSTSTCLFGAPRSCFVAYLLSNPGILLYSGSRDTATFCFYKILVEKLFLRRLCVPGPAFWKPNFEFMLCYCF